MRQLSITFLAIFVLGVSIVTPSFGAVKGGIQYSIPTDYSHLSEPELKEKADKYYFLAKNTKDKELSEDMTNALVLYSVLQNINPKNQLYSIRLGILYDKIGLDRYAKGNFSRAIGIDSSKPEPYFYFGEFYYKRQLYRKALKYYKECLQRKPVSLYDLYYKMGDIYEKLGDTKSALNYLEQAKAISPNESISDKIQRIKTFDSVNKEFYSK